MKKRLFTLTIAFVAVMTVAYAQKRTTRSKAPVRKTAVAQSKSPAKAVDLGLPSGTLWASCNVGATKPEEYGDYFAWGETKGYKSGKRDFSWSTYKWCKGASDKMTKYCDYADYGNKGFTDNKKELDLADDAAYVNWGSSWRMPSLEQIKELIDNCYWEWTTLNGVYGHNVTSLKNKNSIFLPAAGNRGGTSLVSAGSYGGYWSRSLALGTLGTVSAYSLYFDDSMVDEWTGYEYAVWNPLWRIFGRSVRAVRR